MWAEGGPHGTQHRASRRHAEVDGRDRRHLRDTQEPSQRPRPAGPAQVRPGGRGARPLPRGALTGHRTEVIAPRRAAVRKETTMRSDIHPAYRPVVFRDRAAGATFLTRSTARTSRTIERTDGST